MFYGVRCGIVSFGCNPPTVCCKLVTAGIETLGTFRKFVAKILNSDLGLFLGVLAIHYDYSAKIFRLSNNLNNFAETGLGLGWLAERPN